MTSLWKWAGLAACGVGLAVAANRMNVVTAAEDAPSHEKAAGSPDRLDRIAQQLERLLERMEGRMDPGPPRGDRRGPPQDGPHREGPPRDRPEWGGHPPRMPHEMPPEVRDMLEKRMNEGRERMQQARDEMKARMEQAREKFQHLEERVKALEAEVERLKAAK